MTIASMWRAMVRAVSSDKHIVHMSTIQFKDGDTIVLTTERVLRNEQRAILTDQMKRLMPDGVKVVVLDGGLKLAVLSPQREDGAPEAPASWAGSVLHSLRPIPHIPMPSPGPGR